VSDSLSQLEREPKGEPEHQPESEAEIAHEDLDPDQSWWEEPESEGADSNDEAEGIPAAEEADTPAEEPATVASQSIFGSFAPGASKEPTPVVQEDPSDVGAVDEDEDEIEVEEDTEAFLEKVFSELDTSTEQDEEGYGLLRRRRMGALKDSSGDV